jgi:hypothetical protein
MLTNQSMQREEEQAGAAESWAYVMWVYVSGVCVGVCCWKTRGPAPTPLGHHLPHLRIDADDD